MYDIIFNAGDEQALFAEAERLGFVVTSPDGTKSILTQGRMRSGGGYALSIEGIVFIPTGETIPIPGGGVSQVMQPVDGYWGRLRLNGNIEDVPVFSPSIIQYKWSTVLSGWTSDEITLAPEWVGNIGKML